MSLIFMVTSKSNHTLYVFIIFYIYIYILYIKHTKWVKSVAGCRVSSFTVAYQHATECAYDCSSCNAVQYWTRLVRCSTRVRIQSRWQILRRMQWKIRLFHYFFRRTYVARWTRRIPSSSIDVPVF